MVDNLNKAIAKSMFAIQGETEVNVGGSRGINVITDRLHKSTEIPPVLTNLQGVYGDAFVDYAIYVHEGTYKMQARPFLLQAVQTKDETVQKYFKQAVQDTLDEIGAAT